MYSSSVKKKDLPSGFSRQKRAGGYGQFWYYDILLNPLCLSRPYTIQFDQKDFHCRRQVHS